MTRPRRSSTPRVSTIKNLQRGETRLLKVFGRHRAEIDAELLKPALAGPVEALLRTACSWGDLGDDWDLGDYRFVIFEFASGDAWLYVQFWSEPREEVLVEASSGLPNPPAWQLVGAVQRKKLRALGFHRRGKSGNYAKTVMLTPHHFRSMAEEAVHVLVDVFGYRGLTELRAKLHADTRAETARVHAAITPEELQKIVTSIHLDSSEVRSPENGPSVEVNADGLLLTIGLLDRVPRQNLYKRLVVTRADGAVAVIELDGGVTTEYLRRQLKRLVEEAIVAAPVAQASALVH